MSDGAPAGTIHDIGYQRYTGPRLGRGYAIRSLYTHGVRTAFGLGRSAKAKIFPWFCGSVMLLVAIVDVVIRSQTGRLAISYVDLSAKPIVVVLLFLATAGPELVSRDLRAKVLPLYFSRPMGRADYAVAKWAALVSSTWLIMAVPLTVVFLGGAFSLHGVAIWHDFTHFAGGLFAAAVIAVVYSTLSLFISSLLGRRMIAWAVIVAVFLVSSAVGAAIGQIVGGNGVRAGNLVSPILTVNAFNGWAVNSDPDAYGAFGAVYLLWIVVFTAICWLALLARYRRVSA